MPPKPSHRKRNLLLAALAALAVWVAVDLATGAGTWSAVGRYTANLLGSAGPTRDLARSIGLGAGPKGRRIELRVWDWWSPATTEAYETYFNELERRFEAAHPDVDVVFQAIPFGNYQQKLATGMIGRNPPDVLQVSVSWAQGLYRRGMIRPLNEFVDATPDLQPDKFMSSAWYHNHVDGTVFGIPHIVDAACLLWNLDMLREDPGLHFMFERDPDGKPDFTRIRFDAIRDWDHFRRIVKRLHRPASPGGKDKTRYGFIMNAYSMGARSYMPWAATNGVDLQDRAGTRATFDNPAGTEALQFMIDVVYKDGVCPPFTRDIESHGPFQRREVACAMAGTFSGKYIYRNTNWGRFGMTAFPPGPRGKGQRTIAWANMMAISSRCKRPELAWEYIRMVAGPEAAALRLKVLKMNSPRLDFYGGDAWADKVREYPFMHNMQRVCAAGAPIYHTETQAVRDEMRPVMEYLMLNWKDVEAGKGDYTDPADALGEIAERINKVYDRYNRNLAGWSRPTGADDGGKR